MEDFMKKAIALFFLLAACSAFSAPQYKYFTFRADSAYNILGKRLVTLDSNRYASDSEFRDYAAPYMTFKYGTFVAGELGDGRIITGLAGTMDPNNYACFARVYPCAIVSNVLMDAMNPWGSIRHDIYGDSLSAKPSIDTIKPDGYYRYKTSMRDRDTLFSDQDLSGLSGIMSDSDIVALRQFGPELILIKDSLIGAYGTKPFLRYLIIVTNTIAIPATKVGQRNQTPAVRPLLSISSRYSTSSVIRYALPEKDKCLLRIVSIKGEIVFEKTIFETGSIVWEASRAAAGFYFWEIGLKNMTKVGKFLLVK
jgi:hypothetical protein